QEEWLADKNIDLVRGRARVTGPGAVEVGDRAIAFDRILVATGSVPTIPPIPGLAEVEHWTNREATSTHEVPGRLIVIGAGPLGFTISKRGVEVDEHLRAAENVWAAGDVTGIAMFTHVGKYQARLAAADMAGRDARADYRAIPAVTFTDPQVASVGDTAGDGT